jgi:hypothetical protein
MSSSGYGQAPKKETVYSGPTPTPKQGTVYNGPSVQTAGGTVYNGPAAGTSGGTVYNGPAAGGTVYNGPAPGGTVYGAPPTGAVTSRPMAPNAAAASGDLAAAKGARILYLIAGFTGVNAVLIFVGIRFAVGLGTTEIADGSLNTALIASVLGAGIFVALGMFAQRGSKAAFLIGMLLYGGDLVLLVMNNPAFHVVSIVIHALFLFYLFSAYRQLPD